MSNGWRCFIALWHRDTSGVTAMEYAMIAAATIVAIAGTISTMSGRLVAMFGSIAASLP